MLKYLFIISFLFQALSYAQTFFPLNNGDKYYSWYYDEEYYFYLRDGTRTIEEYLDSTIVGDSVIINNKVYKKLWDRYYHLFPDNKLNTIVDNQEKLAVDFNKLEGGDTLYYDGLRRFYNYYGIDSVQIGENYIDQFRIYFYKHTFDSVWYYPEKVWERGVKFVENIGPIDYLQKSTYWDPDLSFGSIKKRITYFVESNGQTFNLLTIPRLITSKIISDDSITITFNDRQLPFEDGFIIERKESSQQEFEQIGTTMENSTFFADSNFELAKSYQYRVKSYVNSVISLPSNVKDVVSIINPTGLIADTLEQGEIIISWNYNSLLEPNFVIERKTKLDGSTWGDYIILDTLDSNPHVFADTSVDKTKPNKYKMKAVVDSLFSLYSSELLVLPNLAPPFNLTSNVNEYESVRLEWEHNQGENIWYKIDRRKLPANYFLRIFNGFRPDNSFIDENVDDQTNYQYRVAAKNQFVQSDFSDTTEIYIPEFQPIQTPSNFTAVLINVDSVKLSWIDNSTNEKYFKLLRGKDSLSIHYIGEVLFNSNTYLDTIPILSGSDAELWYGIRAENPHSQSDLSLFYLSITNIYDNQNQLPTEFNLSQNYPNPFNPITVIKYDLPTNTHVQIKIYDVLGREVIKLVDEEKQAGNYNVIFNSSRFSSGIYYYQMKAGKYRETKKMVLVK